MTAAITVAIVVVMLAITVAIVVVVIMSATAVVGLVTAVNGVDFNRGAILDFEALAAVIANFKRIEIAKFAFATTDTVAVV